MTRQPETSGAAAILGEVVAAAPDATCGAARHGTRAAYLKGCRCDTARQAYNRYQKQWLYDRTHGRPRRISVIGARRRVQALACLGWSAADIGAQLGRRGRLNLNRGDVITVDLHLRIVDLFDRLAATRGPSPTTATLAAERGWLPPLAWDDDTIDDVDYKVLHGFPKQPSDDEFIDEVAVDRYLDGDATIRLSRNEKIAALVRLVGKEYNLYAAAARLGINGHYARLYAVEAGLDVGSRRDDEHMDANQGDAA